MTDYYAILGISHAAHDDEIAKAYRRAALTYNPECNQDAKDVTELARRFKLVSQAYVVLSDTKTRAIYDSYGDAGVRQGNIGSDNGLAVDQIDPNVVFRRFFGVDNPFQIIGTASGLHGTQHHFFSASAAAVPSPKAMAASAVVEVTLEEVFSGCRKTATWNIDQSSVSVDIEVPRGVESGSRLQVTHSSGSAANVTIVVVPHPKLIREGDDLSITVPIKLVEALSGTTVKVTLIDGRDLHVRLDEIVHPGFSRRIDGEGLPNRSTGKRGDLIVRCDTEFPKYLTAEQRRELRRVLADE